MYGQPFLRSIKCLELNEPLQWLSPVFGKRSVIGACQDMNVWPHECGSFTLSPSRLQPETKHKCERMYLGDHDWCISNY